MECDVKKEETVSPLPLEYVNKFALGYFVTVSFLMTCPSALSNLTK